jgi:hypothetical protein
MFARVTTFQSPPERIGEGIAMYREQVMPWLRDSTGFRGWIALIDRENRRALSVTFWATPEAAADSPESGAALRDEIAASIGATLESLDIYEVAVADDLALEDVG